MPSIPTELAFGFRLDRGDFRLDVDLLLPARGIVALFGRSGCGKTTLLRCIAGLEHAHGHCRLNGEVWQNDDRGVFLPTHQRPIGYVFQEPSLFPHLSVRHNLEYGFNRVPEVERRVSFDEAVRLLGIRQLLERGPTGLSGGERQRVSIARALLTNPRLLLMDEPLSALDQRSRQDILPYLERLHDTLNIPVLYVSHSSEEVARLADHIVLLEDGQVLASGLVTELTAYLGSWPAGAADRETVSVINAVIRGHDERYQLSEIAIAGGWLAVPRIDRCIGASVRIRIHARDVSLTMERPASSSIMSILPARVIGIEASGEAQVLVRLGAGDGGETILLALITCRSRDALGLAPGMAVYAQVTNVVLMD